MGTETVTKKPINQQIEEFLSIVASFSTLIENETTALKKAKFKEVNAMQENKKFHAKRYEENIKLLTSRRDELTSIDLETREKLRAEREKFNLLLEQNKRALLNAKDSTIRVANFILESARKAATKNKETCYSNNAKTETYNSATSSVSFDTSL
jgi:hypothetical protein